MKTILAIETSCDETAAAIVTTNKQILSNEIFSQMPEHSEYGGVVPEIAARAHLEHIDSVVTQALESASMTFSQLDAIAVTAGPGLIGGVIVGVMAAKSYASVHSLPIYAVNHLEGHALSARLTEDIEFPYLLLLVSGGHCQILIVKNLGKYKLLGATIDDSLGEAFDKVAKMMGLGYPGGPIIEKLAKSGDPKRFKLPKPLIDRDNCDLSFSGLKTAVRNNLLLLNQPLSEQDKKDMAASFQYVVGKIWKVKLQKAIDIFKAEHKVANSLVIGGGVAANLYLREIYDSIAGNNNMTLHCPPLHLCTDNAAMIGWAAAEYINAGKSPDSLDFEPRARWSLVGG